MPAHLDHQPDSADHPPIRPVELFLFHEASLIDQRRFEAWLQLFTDDPLYWLPIEENQNSGAGTVSIVYDDRRLLETRVRRLRHPRTHAQVPLSHTCHFVTNIAIERVDRGKIVVCSNQLVAEFRNDQQRLFAGRCTHELVACGNSFKISMKRVDLIDSEGEHRGISIII